jgi:hypothetical protein
VTNTRADEYRRRAQECLVAARWASTEEGRAALVEMASTWFRLADEQSDDIAGVEAAWPPSVAEQAQPPAQQQQQIQPKDDDDEQQ